MSTLHFKLCCCKLAVLQLLLNSQPSSHLHVAIPMFSRQAVTLNTLLLDLHVWYIIFLHIALWYLKHILLIV